MTIRARLTLAVVILVVAATGIVGWVVVGAARDDMVDRLDERLVEAATRPLREGPGSDRLPGDQRSIAEIIVAGDGTVVRAEPAGFGDDPEPLPELPAVPSDEAEAMIGRIVTVGSQEGDDQQRLLTQGLSPRLEGYRFLSTSLADVDATISRLWVVYVVTLATVAAAGAGVAWLIVRRGLQPIDRMIETAGTIAGGEDLTARVEHPGDATELGRLGAALDGMLGRLEVAFDEKDASEARLKRFAADASHELRTPITAIHGYAELYQRGGLAEREALDRAMGRIESESARMGRLVEDLLLLARLDQQRPLEHRSVDLHQVVLDAVADHEALGDGHPLTVDAPGSVAVVGDESGLRQVVGNLLTNARTHTPAGTPVRVSLHAVDGSAVLVVADGGPGIPPDQLGRVFERFHRGDPSRSRETGGAGLGLSIVAALVAAHGGTVTATNDGGARFQVTLPLA